MIVTAVLTLTLLVGAPDDLVQIFAPTQGVSIEIAPREGCVQVDDFLIQCWAAVAHGLQMQARYTCPTRNAILTVKREASVSVYELACRWRLFAPAIASRLAPIWP